MSIAAIIPCYNGAAFLAEAIQSALDQTHPVAKVVVVDDGSTDSSVAIAEGFASRGLPVVCLRTSRNGGPSAARNLGLHRVDDAFAAFLDADDVWLPNHCADLVALLDRFPAAVLAYGDFRFLGGGAPPSSPPRPSRQPFDALLPLFEANIVLQSAAIVRREAVLAAGGYSSDMRYAEDFDLWLRLARFGPFVGSGSVSCLRREHAAQATRQSRKMFDGAWGARRRAYARLYRNGTDSTLLASADAAIAGALEHDLRDAWHSRDRSLVRFVLESAAKIDLPGVRAKHGEWARRLYYYWPAWRAAAAVWDAMPEMVRSYRAQRARAVAALTMRPETL